MKESNTVSSVDSKTVHSFYVSRLIDSLENDYKKWEIKYCGGGPGWAWTEYYSPEYVNSNGVKLQFAETLNYTGAYIDGAIGWTIGFADWWNPFSYRTRRLRRAFNKMKSYLRTIEREKRTQKLIKSL